MNIEQLREYCLTLPLVTEDMPFGEDCLVFRLKNKIFACISLARNNIVALKCDPSYALILREEHSQIQGAFHWNKKYWNDVILDEGLESSMIHHLVCHAYNEVNKKLPKKDRVELLENGTPIIIE